MTKYRDEVIADFGEEWVRFDYLGKYKKNNHLLFNDYFQLVSDKHICLSDKKCFDFGAGSGRWAAILSEMCGSLTVIEPSKAIDVAKKAMATKEHVKFMQRSTRDYDGPIDHYDFGICLGVLHHTDDTENGLRLLHSMLIEGGSCLIYLYSDLEEFSWYYRFLWRVSNMIRLFVSRMPTVLKNRSCDLLAWILYLPLSRISLVLSLLKLPSSLIDKIPLSYYKNKSIYVMRTDSLDRFGTKLEKRYSKSKIEELVRKVGFRSIQFSDKRPHWVFLATK